MSEDFNYTEPGLGLTADNFPTHLSASQLKAHWQPWESPGQRLRADWEPEEEEEHEFWDRKIMGSQMRKHGKHSLYESIRKKGVLDPVQVALDNIGSTGFPMITGGHHRIAVMGSIDPDKPIPVEHRELPDYDYNWEDD